MDTTPPAGLLTAAREILMERLLHIKPRYYRWHVDPGVEWVEANTGYAHLNWQIPLAQTALVLLDVWDRHYLIDTEARAEAIIQQNVVPLVAACRRAGLRLIHAPSPGHNMAQDHPNWVNLVGKEELNAAQDEDWPPREFRQKTGDFSRYALPAEPRDTERAALRANLAMHPDVLPAADEPVVACGEELHRYCKQQGILFLFYLGFNTNACILHRDYGTLKMAERGYDVVIVRDCTTGMESFETREELWQTRVSVQILEMFGKYSITASELIEGLPQ